MFCGLIANVVGLRSIILSMIDRKPNGQHVISPEIGAAFIEAVPVSKFHGIGSSYRRGSASAAEAADPENSTLLAENRPPRCMG
jgi:hypothetical protein